MVFDAVFLTHGETDGVRGDETYADEVLKMQADYAHDLMGITGQESEPVLILSQQNTCPPVQDLHAELIDQMWRVQQRSEGKVICSGPKYQYSYPDGLHLPAGGYSRLGEKYGQVLSQLLLQGKVFKPLAPRKARLVDECTIQVEFDVPVPPLSWDEHLPDPHQRGPHTAFIKGRGFEVRDAEGKELEIAGVFLKEQQNEVIIQLTKSTTSQPTSIAYAAVQNGEGFGPGFEGGTGDGRMGQLCDSDESTLSETVRCCVLNGSNIIESASGWETRAAYDRIEPGDLAIKRINTTDTTKAYLDRPWTGTSGWQDMKLRHNQRNYCVSFVMDIDEP